MLKVAVAGAGVMGRNLLRVFHALPGAELLGFCDRDPLVRRLVGESYPGMLVAEGLDQLLEDRRLEAVAVAGESWEHFALARAALAAGKHVLVDKPLARTVAQAEELVRLAGASGLVLMSGHLMLYHPAVELLAEQLRGGELGEVRYIYTVRANLGRFDPGENALWALAPHDLSLVLELVGRPPLDVVARGASFLRPGVEDVVFLNLRFPDGVMANIQLSWIDPSKKRQVTVVGSRKMAVFDDMEAAEKLRIYDKGADYRVDFQSYEEFLSLRNGDIRVPRVPRVEPLLVECGHFLECVTEGRRPRTAGEEGLEVVRVVCAAERSMREGGSPVSPDPAV